MNFVENMDRKKIKKLADACTELQRKVVRNIISQKYASNTKAYQAERKDISADTAKANVCKMLTNHNVIAYKTALEEIELDKSILTREQAMRILSEMATTNITDVATYETVKIQTEDGRIVEQGIWAIKNSDQLTEAQARSIMSVKASTQGIEIKQHDQKAAIQQLSKMQGWDAAEQRIVTHKTPVPIKITDDMSLEEMAKAYEEKRKQLGE